ncbi:hypothetical protein B857_03948 [Solibacillus isronensis B3W22]|uniref:Uncharacterized protein n=1 Tax=Solibacillus isronensis B3W22 TaxID=1224748 RepID=K1KXH3_9BACL|nr:hypothetical protein B857_03948 [Solibacillus isronensis B3W22]
MRTARSVLSAVTFSRPKSPRRWRWAGDRVATSRPMFRAAGNESKSFCVPRARTRAWKARVASEELTAREHSWRIAESSPSSLPSSRTGVRRGSRGKIIMINKPHREPTTASRERLNGPAASAIGNRTTSTDCRPNWVVKMGPESRNLAIVRESSSTNPACQRPLPSMVSSKSPTATPKVQPMATSRERRNVVAVPKPSTSRPLVAAKIGSTCPSSCSAIQNASTAERVIWMILGKEVPTRRAPTRLRRLRNLQAPLVDDPIPMSTSLSRYERSTDKC